MEPEEFNISALPEPTIVEEVSFEALFEDRKARMVEQDERYAAALALESEPLTIDFQVSAYREYILRQRINLAAQARLLAKATGADLDHLGDFYGLPRKPNETDPTYRRRIRERIQGSSTAGSRAHYRTRANEADPAAIRDIAVDSPQGGLVRISIQPQYSDDPDLDVAQFERDLVARVAAHVNHEAIKMLTDTVQVQLAEKVPVAVRADIRLNPTTPRVVVEEIGQSFRQKWGQMAALGWDVTPSWVLSQLHRAGVYEVNLHAPSSVAPISPNQTAHLSALELNLLEGSAQ